MNPGPGLLSDALLRTGRVTLSDYRYFSSLFTRFDIFHVHWPERSVFPVALPKRIAKVLLFLVFVYLCKARGGRVIWMANNIGSHEGASPRLERLLWRYFLPRVDHVIHLCPASADLIKNLAGPLPPGTVLAHPHYRPHFAALNSSAEPRLKLDLPKDSFVVGCFGSTRRYKGIDLLIGAMREWNRKDAVLLYGGPPISRELQKEIEALAGGDPRIKLFIRPLSDTELRDLIEASDVIAMPYRKILNSGVAMGAVSLNRPILGPAVGCVLDYEAHLGPDWVLTYDGTLDADDLERAYLKFRGRDKSAECNLDWMDPDRVAKETVRIYEQTLQLPPR